MDFTVQYLQDEKGKRTAVQIPIKEWEALQKKLRHDKEYSELKESLTQAFKEVKLMQEGKLPKKTLDEFLNEL
ncbi:hypothetical protein [Ekhidna sp.]|uniref:hypothetical protein n=1 Tax=Ekhidna sp. TaxID=2608089 RepID=UPI003CCC3EB3